MADPMVELAQARDGVRELESVLADMREVMAQMVVDAWLDGHSLRAIAEASGYSHQWAHRIVKAATAELAAQSESA